MDLIRELSSNPQALQQLQSLLGAGAALAQPTNTSSSSDGSVNTWLPSAGRTAPSSATSVRPALNLSQPRLARAKILEENSHVPAASAGSTAAATYLSSRQADTPSYRDTLLAREQTTNRELRAELQKVRTENATLEDAAKKAAQRAASLEQRVHALHDELRNARRAVDNAKYAQVGALVLPQECANWIDEGMRVAASRAPVKRMRSDEKDEVITTTGAAGRRSRPVSKVYTTSTSVVIPLKVESPPPPPYQPQATPFATLELPQGGSSTRKPPRPAGRRTPRTPSLTEADKVKSASHSIGIGATPRSAMPTITPASLAHVSSAAYATGSGASRSYLPPFAARDAKIISPQPSMPQRAHQPFLRSDEERSQAIGRGGIGGSEAASRGASSTASSIRGPITMPRRPPGYVATRSPSPADPKRGPELERRFMVTALDEGERQRVYQAVHQLRYRAAMVESDSSDVLPETVTHVVTPGTPRSMKALCALVSGRWVVPPSYILNSLAAGYWLDEYEEGCLRIYPLPLERGRFLLAMDAGEVRDLVSKVIEFGRGEVLPHTSRVQVSDGIVVIQSAQQLLDHCMRHH